MNMDSRNGIEHKCPCCGYKTEWDWSKPKGEEFIKGNESFIRIESDNRDSYNFSTDKPKEVSWGLPGYQKAMLLGCPKCGTVSFKLD